MSFPTTCCQVHRNTEVGGRVRMKTTQDDHFLGGTKRGDSCYAECEDVLCFVDYDGAKMSGRSNAEGGREERKEENDARRVENEVMNAVVADDLVTSSTSDDLVRMTETRDVSRNSSALVEESFAFLIQNCKACYWEVPTHSCKLVPCDISTPHVSFL